MTKKVILILPLLVIIDNLIEPEPHKSFAKSDAQNDVNFIRETIKSQVKNKYESIAYMPVDLQTADDDLRYNKAVATTISTMLATQELGISCINGYSGFNPGNFEQFFLNPDELTLENWCIYNNYDKNKIQIINEIGLRTTIINKVNILTSDQKYVCADESLNDAVAANKNHAFDWETFSIIRFENNQCVIKTHRNNYFSIDKKENGVFANSNALSLSNVLIIEYIDKLHVILKANNGKYISVDSNSGKLLANTESKQTAKQFTIQIISK